jgi:5-methylcytosine-specific restriction endonuclease McrA
VELGQVASRDRWVCQLCGKRVRVQSVYHKQATLDHIIPISRGGRHSYQNCQLAHFDCNSKKHNRKVGQQRLF